MTITAEPATNTQLADSFERQGHIVSVTRGAGGRFGRGSRLGDVMHAVAEVDDDDEADGVDFGDGERTINWSHRNADGSYRLDVEDNRPRDEEEDDEADPDDDDDDDEEEEEDDYRGFARLRMSPSDMKRFAAGLSSTLLVHQMQSKPMADDDPHRPIIAALVASTPMEVKFENEWGEQFLEWGLPYNDGSVRLLARDDDGDEAAFSMSLPELRRLHAQLVRQNMEEEDNPFLKRPQTAAVEIIERDGHNIPVNRGAKGRFSKMSAVAKALSDSGGAADSLAEFDRPALMREAKRRDLAVPRGASADAVRQLILDGTREPAPTASTPADLQRGALGKLTVPALKTRAAADGHPFTSKTKKADLIDMIMSGPRNPDTPERVVADRGAGQKSRMSAGELPAANAEIDAMVADPQPWARDRMNNILGRMTVPQLQQVADRHNTHLDTVATTKALKASRLTETLVGRRLDSAAIDRAITSSGMADRLAEEAARNRQAAIDAVRPRTEFLADLEEALGNDTPIAELRRMTNQSLRIRGVAGDPHAEGLASLIATSIDTGEIRRAVNASTAAQGLRRIDAGEPVFDPAQHTPIGKLSKGELVELVRPGYAADIKGEQVTLFKPTVASAPDTSHDEDVEAARRQLRAAQAAGERHTNPDSAAARRNRRDQDYARAQLDRLGAAETAAEQPERDRTKRRRAERRQSGNESPLRGLSGGDLAAALDQTSDEAAVRAGLAGRDLPELVQIARDMPGVTMPERQNRTALVEAIVSGTAGAKQANATPAFGPTREQKAYFQPREAGDLEHEQDLFPLGRKVMHRRFGEVTYAGADASDSSGNTHWIVDKDGEGHMVSSTLTDANNPDQLEGDMQRARDRDEAMAVLKDMSVPELMALSDHLGRARITPDMDRDEAAQKLVVAVRGRSPRREPADRPPQTTATDAAVREAAARYRRELDEVSARMADRLARRHAANPMTGEELAAGLAEIEADRVPALPRSDLPVTSPANASSLKVGDQLLMPNNERVTVRGHQRVQEDGRWVQQLTIEDSTGQLREITTGLNTPHRRIAGGISGGSGTFALEDELEVAPIPEVEAEFAMPEQLAEYWVHGEGAARVRWFVRGAFRRARRLLRQEGVPEHMLDGAVANLYRRATGKNPGAHRRGDRAMAMGEVQTAGAAAMECAAELAPLTSPHMGWRGPLAPIDIATGDKRRFASGALTSWPLPLPFMWQKHRGKGHDGAVTVGALTSYDLADDGSIINAAGYFLDPARIPEVAEAMHLVKHGVVGPSVDLAPGMKVAFMSPTSGDFNPNACSVDGTCPADGEAVITQGEIVGATLVPIAAFGGNVRAPQMFERTRADDDAAMAALSAQTAAVTSHWDDVAFAPIDTPWPGDAAAKAELLAWSVAEPLPVDEAETDFNLYRMGFLHVAGDRRDEVESYGLPIAAVIGNELQIVPKAVFAAAMRLDSLPVSSAEKQALRAQLDDLYDQMAEALGDDTLAPPWQMSAADGCGCAEKWAKAALAAQTADAGTYGVFGEMAPYDHKLFQAQLDGPTPMTVTDDGRVFGHAFLWSTCNRGHRGMCLRAPKSPSGYKEFHLGAVRTDIGLLPVGKIVMGEGHADIEHGTRITRAFYDATSKTAAIGRITEDKWGGAFAGVLAPGMSPQDATMLLASPPSGDWRNRELIAVLAVNTPGHVVARAEVADGEPVNMVAAGRWHDDGAELDAVEEAAALFTEGTFAAMQHAYGEALREADEQLWESTAATIAEIFATK